MITFAWFSAPDLALTQFSVEALIVVLLTAVLLVLPLAIPCVIFGAAGIEAAAAGLAARPYLLLLAALLAAALSLAPLAAGVSRVSRCMLPVTVRAAPKLCICMGRV